MTVLARDRVTLHITDGVALCTGSPYGKGRLREEGCGHTVGEGGRRCAQGSRGDQTEQ